MSTDMRRGRWTLVLAAAAALALGRAGEAGAAYPVQPQDGRTVDTLEVPFLVYYEPADLNPRVYVSRSPTPGSGGSLLLGPGFIRLCTPATPFGEAGKFTCSIGLDEGTYWWQFKYERSECVTSSAGPVCSNRSYFGPIWRFEVKLPALPASVPIMRGPSTRSRQDPRYSKIASEIADRPTSVICWSAAEWNNIHVRRRAAVGEGLEWVLGYVRRGTNVVNLAPEVCNRLDALTYRRLRPRGRARIDFAEAVDTLAHEAIHAGGITSEPVTECYSLQLMDWTAMKLGTNYAYARGMTLLAWNVLYRRIPAQYRTDDCRNDGSLDLLPSTDVWP